MSAKFRKPGVYIEEISKFPPSVAEVETAIPAFIGFTEKGVHNGQSIINKPLRINSLLDYQQIFGFPKPAEFDNTGTSAKCIKIRQDKNNPGNYLLDGKDILDPYPDLKFRLYYCLQMYFANGGVACYVVSCGTYSDFGSTTAAQKMAGALEALKKADEPTLIVFCDAVNLGSSDYYPLYQAALSQAANLKGRFVIIDTRLNEPLSALDSEFRQNIGNKNLSYGAAYYPWLKTSLNYYFDEINLKIIDESSQVWFLRHDGDVATSWASARAAPLSA